MESPEEVFVLDGREFAVGDFVLVKYLGYKEGSEKCNGWFSGVIVKIDLDGVYPLQVSHPGSWNFNEGVYRCFVHEVCSHRENFAG